MRGIVDNSFKVSKGEKNSCKIDGILKLIRLLIR